MSLMKRIILLVGPFIMALAVSILLHDVIPVRNSVLTGLIVLCIPLNFRYSHILGSVLPDFSTPGGRQVRFSYYIMLGGFIIGLFIQASTIPSYVLYIIGGMGTIFGLASMYIAYRENNLTEREMRKELIRRNEEDLKDLYK